MKITVDIEANQAKRSSRAEIRDVQVTNVKKRCLESGKGTKRALTLVNAITIENEVKQAQSSPRALISGVKVKKVKKEV